MARDAPDGPSRFRRSVEQHGPCRRKGRRAQPHPHGIKHRVRNGGGHDGSGRLAHTPGFLRRSVDQLDVHIRNLGERQDRVEEWLELRTALWLALDAVAGRAMDKPSRSRLRANLGLDILILGYSGPAGIYLRSLSQKGCDVSSRGRVKGLQ